MDYQKLKKNFESHGFQTSYFETKEEAFSYLEESLHGQLIGIGGCMTAKEMELETKLSRDNQVLWHWLVPGKETIDKANQEENGLQERSAVALHQW